MTTDARKLCVMCAWRGTCQLKYSMPGGVALHCVEYTRDITLKEPEEEIRKRNVLVVGAGSIGKTTFVRRVLERTGLRAGGYLQREARAGLFGTSQELVLVGGGSEVVVELVSTKAKPGWTTLGRLSLNLSGLEGQVVPHLKEMVASDRIELIVLDEIGRLQCVSASFRQQVVDCITSPKSVLATIPAGEDEEFVSALQARADVTVLHLTYDNRDRLVAQVAFLLTGARAST
ncbi:nucleoside-triphosphatase [Nitrospira sp. Kam-Ns4a]